jgi:hypothetical protein
MGQGYTRTSTATIATGKVINAADFNAEYNLIEDAFNSSTGHDHSGASNGAPIDQIGPNLELIVETGAIKPQSATPAIDIGASGYKFKDGYFSGTVDIDTNADIAGTLNVGAAATLGNNLSVTGTTTLTSTLTANGNVILGSDSADTVTVNADIASHLLTSTGDTYDIGSAIAADKWRNIYITGTANLPTISSTTATVGTLTVSTSLTVPDNSIALGTKTTGNYVASVAAGTAIDIGGTAGEGWTATVNLDLSELTTSTADDDGDYFVVVDSSNAQKKLTKANINLSGFNNDLTLASGTVTSVDSGDYLTGGPITSSGTLAVDATSANTASKVVARDASGNFSAGTISATLSGSATSVSSTLTRGDYLTGSNFNGSAATTWAVDATSANTASKVVARDSNGDFSANTITAALNGNATTATTATTASGLSGVTASAAELNYNDITTLGTSEASKVVTADANGDVNLSEELKAKSYNETYSTVSSSSGTLTIDCETANIFQVTLSENVTTISVTNPPASGTAYGFTLRVVQDTTTRTITWPTSFKFAGGTDPVVTTTGSAVDVYAFFTTDGGTTWYGFVAGQDMK